MKKLFYDLETTGLDQHKCAVHQLACIVEINGKIKGADNLKIRPFEGAEITQKALDTCNVTLAEVKGNQLSQAEGLARFKRLLQTYVDPYDKKDKFHLVGFNNRHFDDEFLREMFLREGDKYFGSWFWADTLDALVLASQYLLDRRERMANFQQVTVGKELGLEASEKEAHDAKYDVMLCRDIYNIVTGTTYEF